MPTNGHCPQSVGFGEGHRSWGKGVVGKKEGGVFTSSIAYVYALCYLNIFTMSIYHFAIPVKPIEKQNK